MSRPKSEGKLLSLAAYQNPSYNAEEQKEKNYIGTQIGEARNRCGLSLAAFSKLLERYGVEVTAAAINKWEMGKAVPNAYQLLAVAHALGIEDDLQFFIEGREELNAEGQKKLRDYKADLIATGKYLPQQRQLAGTVTMITKPFSMLAVSAGTGEPLTDDSFELRDFPASAVPNKADFAVQINGDSMAPMYQDGQIIWVQKTETLRPGEVGVFVYNGDGYVKQLEYEAPREGAEEFGPCPLLVSFNETYAPIRIEADASFRVVGRVL